MENSVKYGMPKVSKTLESHVEQEFFSLKATAVFLQSIINKKQQEIIFLNNRLENEYNDDLFERFTRAIEELKHLEKKVNWEKKQCAAFDNKVERLQKMKSVEFVSDLSKKILAKRRNN